MATTETSVRVSASAALVATSAGAWIDRTELVRYASQPFGAVIMVVGYSLGRAFIYSTPEYALLKLPYQILQAAVGAAAGMLLSFRCGVKGLIQKTLFK